MKLSLKDGVAFSKGIHPKRFWEQVEYNPKTGCWEWQGYLVKEDGYGRFMAMGHSVLAHRYSYMHLVGEIPEDRFICHKCDNPRCVRPEHLYAGTREDNARDAVNRGRITGQKLTPDDVRELRKVHAKTGAGVGALARRFGYKRTTVNNIIHGHAWDWLDDFGET